MNLDLLSIGGALVDFVFFVDFEFLHKFKFKKGSPIERSPLNFLELSTQLNITPHIFSGGSANNVSKIIAGLGLKSGFLGKIGVDPLGDFFNKRTSLYGVTPLIHRENTQDTGRTYVFVTPDGDKTMCPYYGANQHIWPHELRHNLAQIKNVELIFLDSYNLIFNPFISWEQLQKSKHSIALDLSSQKIVKKFRRYILKFIQSRSVQILFSNEDEMSALTGFDDPILACRSLENYCEYIVLMMGKKGSLVVSKNGFETYYPNSCKAIDFTGVGDAFIGGFLYAFLKKRSLRHSLKFATLLAEKNLQTIGAELPIDFLTSIREL